MGSDDPSNTHSEERQIVIGHHAVLFLDVLGQQDAILGLQALPQSEADHAAYLLAIRNSRGKVEVLRRTLTEYLRAYCAEVPGTDELEELRPEERKLFEAYFARKQGFRTQSFCDTVIVYIPLEPVGDCLPVELVYAILIAAGAAVLNCLALGIPVRGGLQINVAMAVEENDIYGPAPLQAYQLESKTAVFPRVAVGSNVPDYIRVALSSSGTDHYSNISRSIAKQCQQLLAQDSAGVYFVDYLAHPFREMLGELAPAVFASATRFVRSELGRFENARDERHSERYRALLNYFAKYEGEWGAPSE